jgi:hypothetical protein
VKAIMDQVNLAFLPDVLVIPVHSTVQFPNSDAVGHQVYSFSSARQFQLPLYRGKPYPPVQFDQPGVVTLGCNIHDNMLGVHHRHRRALLRSHRHARRVAGPRLPTGKFRVRVWHPLLNEPAGTGTQRGSRGDQGSVEFRLAEAAAPGAVVRAPDSWDY